MIQRTGLAVLCLMILLLSGGCAPARRPLLERALTRDQILQRIAERNGGIRSMRGEGSITIESPEASMTGSLDVQIRKPDSVRVDFGGPFGIHVGTLALSRDAFVYYNWRENTVVSGTPDEETLQSTIHIRLGFDEIIRAFTGEFSLPADTGAGSGELSIESESYLLRYITKGWTREYHVDGDAFVVTAFRLLDTAQKPVFIALASDIDAGSDIAMPHLLRIIFPADRRSMTISYGDVTFNGSVNCSFTLPRRSGGTGMTR